jgi:O-antigen/teichoic acid export membrane protein
MAESRERFAFFRQAGWMAFATTAGGLCMYGVHIPSGARLSEVEYGVFLALLQVLNLMLIPAIGLQTVVAQQTAAAQTESQRRQLSHTVRVLLVGGGALWVGMVLAAFLARHRLLAGLRIPDPRALWATLPIGLAMLWWPVLQGVLQGRQDFGWLGALQLVNGLGRFLGVMVLVYLLRLPAAGAMLAALFGFGATVLAAGWRSRDIWRGPGEPVAWRSWLARVIPLTLGLSAGQFAMAVDQILVQNTFPGDVTALYGAAGTIGRGLVFFTGSVFAVMFPKVVASRARGQPTDVLALALGATALLGMGAATACTLLPGLPLRLVYPGKPEYWAMAPLVPWFVWCILPLSLATVLIGHLLARERFQAVPWLLAVALAYGATLWYRQDALRAAERFAAFGMVVRTLGGFSLLLLGVASWFTWGPGRERRGQ